MRTEFTDNIYSYIDFKKYLEDFQRRRQAEDRKFTKARICCVMGMPNNRGYFQNVIKGRKEVTETFIERFVMMLGLDEDQAQYFRVMVRFNQSAIARERTLLFDQLISLNHTPSKLIDADTYAFYRQWYHSAIRAVLDTCKVGGNGSELARRLSPPITLKEARGSIALLSRLGLIEKNGEGWWKPTDKVIDSGPYVKDELVRRYQLETIELAKKTVLSSTYQKKNISTLTLSMSEETRDLVEAKLQKFKSEVTSLVHKDPYPAQCVYQLNIQYFSQLQAEGKRG